ncbi:MAG TPA: hypothetical protein ENN03_10970 [bacterium]|nr:hypothetical protein [bacterium]
MMKEELVRIDKSKNRIYLYLEGFMDVDRARKLHDAYKEAISQCTPGFTVVTFAEDYKPGTPEVQELLRKMAKMAEHAGCRKVARVVGKTPLGGMQINRIVKSQATYPSRHFATAEEADAYLDSGEDE